MRGLADFDNSTNKSPGCAEVELFENLTDYSEVSYSNQVCIEGLRWRSYWLF